MHRSGLFFSISFYVENEAGLFFVFCFFKFIAYVFTDYSTFGFHKLNLE